MKDAGFIIWQSWECHGYVVFSENDQYNLWNVRHSLGKFSSSIFYGVKKRTKSYQIKQKYTNEEEELYAFLEIEQNLIIFKKGNENRERWNGDEK